MKKHILTGICALCVYAVANISIPAVSQEHQSPQIIGEVFEILSEKFVSKSEIDFEEMLKEGLNNLEISIDEVLVKWNKNEKSFELVVGERRKSFRSAKLRSWSDLEKISSEVFSFVSLSAHEWEKENEKIEYTMVNGMLAAIDRHSRIIPPRDYKDFIIETEGSFSGLGIVISTRKGWITVISPIEDTPAYRAGIKAGDKIVQIENESTVNMSLVEAVHRLRGPKGEPLNIRILRDSMEKPEPLTIVRDIIKIESVEDYVFSDGILYMKIKNFQRNTTESAVEALKKRKKERKITGIILDLRDNPGGLLSQAGLISDLFLKYGTVFSVKTGDDIRERPANARDIFELREKTVVLINSGTASASEIVTGALKENDRALTMGTKTFGKGSIQDIFELEDGSALKLTIGGYLIPGNISIHKVGIMPDIFIEQVDFSEKRTIYKTPEFSFLLEKYREENKNEKDWREPNPPFYAFKILNESLLSDDDENKKRKNVSKKEKMKEKEKDPLITAARRIINMADGAYRSDMLKTAGKVLESIGEEDGRIREKLAKFKVDWSLNGETTEKKPQIRSKITPANGIFKAGEKSEINIEVTNLGSEPIYRLTAVTDSGNPLLDNKEFIFGKIDPGKKSSWKTELKIPDNASTRNDECVIRFFDSSKKEVFSQTFTAAVEGKVSPSISYNYEIIDDGRFGSKGNGDGRIDKKETISLLFRIKNTGKSEAEELGIYLKNRSGKKLFLEKAIEQMGEIKPGESKDVVMKFSVKGEWGKEEYPDMAEFDLIANDFQIGFFSKYEITIPAHEPAGFSRKKEIVQTTADAVILGGSFEDAQEVSVAKEGSSYISEGRVGEWSKVRLDKKRSGWIKTDITSPSQGKAKPDFIYALKSPPAIRLGSQVLLTDKKEIEINGSVSDSDPVVNISFFNNGDKIHIINSEGKNQNFKFNLPLEDGVNELKITAKDSGNLKSVRTFYIRKKS
ncbi:MXAN_5808 family serine peptidase [Candidatus Mycalebacterium sp.]